MRSFSAIGCLLALGAVACVPVRPAPATSASVPTAAGASTPSPAAPDGVDPEREEFETKVRPILEARCTPCHFPGGKMYGRLPFDQPGTIRVLGTELFTRINAVEEHAAMSACPHHSCG